MRINPEFGTHLLTSFIRQELAKLGYDRGILGLSGGLDSSVCAFLAVRALGPEQVTALIMPYGDSFPQEKRDAEEVASLLGCRKIIIDIKPMVDAYFSLHPTDNPVQKGNKMARERMSILYDYGKKLLF